MAALPHMVAVAAGFVLCVNVAQLLPYPINITLPVAGSWAVVGIVATVFMVSTGFMVSAGRTGWLDKAARVSDEQAAGDSTAQPPAGP